MKLEKDQKLQPEPGAADFPTAAPPSSRTRQRYERGRVARREVPRGAHAGWAPAPDRPDPVDLLEAQARDRIEDLMPIRYSRMMASPFAFMRGSAIVMAQDLAGTPKTGIRAQLCGDAHLLNFGAYLPGACPALRPQRLRRDLAWTLGMGRETPRRELRGGWPRQRLRSGGLSRGRPDVRGLLPAADGRVLRDGRARGLVLAHRRGGSPQSALRCQKEDHEETEQVRAEGARPRQPAGPLQVDQGRRWTPHDSR